MDYKAAGVDIDAGNEVVRRIRGLARGTFTPRVLSDLGSFGGLFRLGQVGADPVLVASADGVGTKLRVAFMTGVHDTIGIDLVNHCVNDILVQGAEPLFFLDYLATGRLDPDVAVQIVAGLAEGCRQNGCALLGGETAEMPGFYADDEYDVAGFIVGLVDRERVIDGSRIVAGDVLIGLPSTGLHTNGYSLARQIVFDRLRLGVRDDVPELGTTVGAALLAPHRSYLRSSGRSSRRCDQGDGAHHRRWHHRQSAAGAAVRDGSRRPPGNVGCACRLPMARARRAVPKPDMLRTFNMGIGLVLVVAADDPDRVIARLRDAGEPDARVIGEIRQGARPQVSYAD